jgi:ABC-type Fe3+ transport system substrate-binding protein
VFWKERYDAFIDKYKTVSFDTIGQALSEKGGWNTIANKPDWGLFKFGHTHPNKSNSGLATLTLMGYEYQKKERNLTLKDILDPNFQTWMTNIENGVSGLSDSTGTMMRDMVLRGPSSYDCLFVYESVVIDYLANAEGRWGELHVVYPQRNLWNDNPFYIIDAPWSTAEQRQATGEFLDFILSEPIQKQALDHGFRPGNPQVPVKFPESPLVVYQKYGLQIDIGATCEPPKEDVINNLLAGWQRSQGSR